MNNQVALNLIEAIVSAKCNTIIATIVTDNGSVYENITVDTTKEYVSEYIKPADRDSNFKTIKYDNINGIRIMA